MSYYSSVKPSGSIHLTSTSWWHLKLSSLCFQVAKHNADKWHYAVHLTYTVYALSSYFRFSAHFFFPLALTFSISTCWGGGIKIGRQVHKQTDKATKALSNQMHCVSIYIIFNVCSPVSFPNKSTLFQPVCINDIKSVRISAPVVVDGGLTPSLPLVKCNWEQFFFCMEKDKQLSLHIRLQRPNSQGENKFGCHFCCIHLSTIHASLCLCCPLR